MAATTIRPFSDLSLRRADGSAGRQVSGFTGVPSFTRDISRARGEACGTLGVVRRQDNGRLGLGEGFDGPQGRKGCRRIVRDTVGLLRVQHALAVGGVAGQKISDIIGAGHDGRVALNMPWGWNQGDKPVAGNGMRGSKWPDGRTVHHHELGLEPCGPTLRQAPHNHTPYSLVRHSSSRAEQSRGYAGNDRGRPYGRDGSE
jgi:hypothetical protein